MLQDQYLKTFCQIGGIIHTHFGKDDFADRLLDILILGTKAERGALFLIDDRQIRLAAGRNVDGLTIKNIKRLSKTVIQEVKKKGNPVYSDDAIIDPRFKKSKSVFLNENYWGTSY